MTRKRVLAATLAVVLFLAIATGANGSVLVKGVLTTNGYRWHPRSVSVATGTKVVWKAVTGSHTVTAWKGLWSKNTTLAAGTTTSFTFRQAGVYKYRCRFHSTLVDGVCSGMCGKVVVG